MDLLETLQEELKNKHLSDDEKIRYIYLRNCQTFSFDTRWHYTALWNDLSLKLQLKRRTFNVHNIDDSLVICHSDAKSILKPLVQELTSYDCKIDGSLSHSRAVAVKGLRKIILDAAYGDLARVKYGIETYHYCDNSDNDTTELDKELGFNLIPEKIYVDELDYGDPITILSEIKYILNTYKFKNFSDALYIFDSLTPILSIYSETFVDKNYNFHKFICLNKLKRYYELSFNGEYYSLNEILYDRYDQVKCDVRYRSHKYVE